MAAGLAAKSKVLVILGMHRSGTSLTAQWLHYCGLNLGDVLLGKSASNKFGHFEDKDFLDLHRDILAANDLSYDIAKTYDIQLSTYHREKAKMLIALKSKLYPQWGWKEPRTCLFIKYWDEFISNAHYLIVYRNFEEVVDSLLRREYNKPAGRINWYLKYRQRIKLYWQLDTLANHFLATWIVYNRALIDFITTSGNDNIMLISQDNLIDNSARVIDRITEEWGFDLEQNVIDVVYKNKHMRKQTKFNRKFSPENLREAKSTYNQLTTLANVPVAN